MTAHSIIESPDAALLALAHQLEVADQAAYRLAVLLSSLPEGDTFYTEIDHRWEEADQVIDDLVNRICATPALTEQGKIVKARSMQYLDVDEPVLPDGKFDMIDRSKRIGMSLAIDIGGKVQPLTRK
jgi:hypothetical protein